MKKIGNISLKNPYFLAPMEGINDLPFRILCKKAGAGMVYTGMIHPMTQEKLHLEDNPSVQIFCTSEKGVENFIKKS